MAQVDLDAEFLGTADVVRFVSHDRPDPAGGYVAELPGAKRGRRKCRLRTLPEELGDVLAASRPVESQNWGRIYLIRLRRPVKVSGRPVRQVWIPGRRSSWNGH
ncbi:MAG: hypothetical protein J7M21_00145 [Planctomycetes bacterium]|nr:hypothetical protein [Planctomycetota bacterium]